MSNERPSWGLDGDKMFPPIANHPQRRPEDPFAVWPAEPATPCAAPPEPPPPKYTGVEDTSSPCITDAEAVTHRLLLGIQSQLHNIANLLEKNMAQANATPAKTFVSPTVNPSAKQDVDSIWGSALRK